MQKTFIKYTAGIVTTAISPILAINFIFISHMLETQQFHTFYAKTEQMIHTLENNQKELRVLNESLNEDYLIQEPPPNGTLCAVVMLDLDYFKNIIDTYGHDIGDLYLKRFADIMTSVSADHVICARRSGDKFCLFIYDYNDKSDIRKCLKSFYQALSTQPITLSDTHARIISVSGGYACTDDKSASITQLLAHADEALYKVKKATKGSYSEYTT